MAIEWFPCVNELTGQEMAVFAVCGCGTIHNAEATFVLCPKCRERGVTCGDRPGYFAVMAMYRRIDTKPESPSECSPKIEDSFTRSKLKSCGRCGKSAVLWVMIGDCGVCLPCLDESELEANSYCEHCEEHMSHCHCEDL